MPTLEELRRRKGRIEEIALQNGVTSVRVFGSVARGTAKEGSDVDLLVTMAPRSTLLDLAGFELALEDELGAKVEAVTERALHPMLEQPILLEAQVL